MASSRQAVGLIATLFIAALMAAFLLPVAIGAISGPENVTANQSVSETIVLQGDLNATVDSTTAGTSATYTISTDTDSATTTVNVGSEATVTVDGTEITINTTEATSNYAVQTYSFPTTYGWSASATAMWVILPLMLVLGVFLYITAVATSKL